MSKDDWPESIEAADRDERHGWGSAPLTAAQKYKRDLRSEIEADDTIYEEARKIVRAKCGARYVRRTGARRKLLYQSGSYELHNTNLKPWEIEIFNVWAEMVRTKGNQALSIRQSP